MLVVSTNRKRIEIEREGERGRGRGGDATGSDGCAEHAECGMQNAKCRERRPTTCMAGSREPGRAGGTTRVLFAHPGLVAERGERVCVRGERDGRGTAGGPRTDSENVEENKTNATDADARCERAMTGEER